MRAKIFTTGEVNTLTLAYKLENFYSPDKSFLFVYMTTLNKKIYYLIKRLWMK